eukprot:SAG11_NODE_2616_length_3170_cov_1.068382_2_plen_164_part_00
MHQYAQKSNDKAKRHSPQHGSNVRNIGAPATTKTQNNHAARERNGGGAASWCPSFKSRTTHRLLLPHHRARHQRRSNTARRHSAPQSVSIASINANNAHTHTTPTNARRGGGRSKLVSKVPRWTILRRLFQVPPQIIFENPHSSLDSFLPHHCLSTTTCSRAT